MESCRKPAQNSSIADSVAFSCISPIYLTKTEIISRTISLIAQEFILNASTSDPFASISIPPKLFIVGMPRLSFGRFYTSHRRLFKMRPPPIPFLSTPDLQFFSPQTEVRFRTIYPRSLKITKAELQLIPLLPAPWLFKP